MGGWDELCVLTGIRPLGGPRILTTEVDLTATAMAEEISRNSSTNITELRSTLKDALTLCSRSAMDQNHWWPDGFGDGGFFDTAIAIGYFGQFGDCNAIYWDEGRPRAAGGRGVELRRVRSSNGYGGFNILLPLNEASGTASPWYNNIVRESTSCTSRDRKPNFFVLEGPYRYLEAWIDRGSLPVRSLAFPQDSNDMGFASELYEIINSRLQGRVEYDWHEPRVAGYLPGIEYDGIEASESGYQDTFYGTRKGSHWTGLAISRGLQGKELVPYLIKDFKAWICMRPDLWPSPPTTFTSPFVILKGAWALTNLHNLPQDVLLQIFALLQLSDIMNLSSTSKGMRLLITNPGMLSAILRWEVLNPHGQLRWILPVAAFPKEVEQAEKIAQEWLTSSYTLHYNQNPTTSTSLMSAFQNQAFPYYAFIPTYLTVNTSNESFSMSSRRRLWKQVQQFQNLWLEYRTNGWDTDIFPAFNPKTLEQLQIAGME
ncbi:uncharacterized protein C8R40DRAFT_1147710 [Lentinula edodes]|uniref:uncharacterized protein n=1 Tax=Lentinula edodes TaxID=5353 RepID=UPI001E8CC31F|nr:uncharacterized protein C8R40DRAFT_1147710 [Lentinula edodes]KAH7874971.1 hypothetical protein C8R40DRAFT_1147710 [Lentinula edodes]